MLSHIETPNQYFTSSSWFFTDFCLKKWFSEFFGANHQKLKNLNILRCCNVIFEIKYPRTESEDLHSYLLLVEYDTFVTREIWARLKLDCTHLWSPVEHLTMLKCFIQNCPIFTWRQQKWPKLAKNASFLGIAFVFASMSEIEHLDSTQAIHDKTFFCLWFRGAWGVFFF